MCGRYVGFTDEQEEDIAEIIHAVGSKVNSSESQLSFKMSGEIFPTDRVPVLLNADRKLTAAIMQWGYPGYPDKKNPKRKPTPLINAKSETAATLYTWRDSVAARRCIIPSCGFYEWQHGGANDKMKYIFKLPDNEALYMAAIYKPFQTTDYGVLSHFSILTTAVNENPYAMFIPVCPSYCAGTSLTNGSA
jgi:putative SOS response-associated peptidase YedK